MKLSKNLIWLIDLATEKSAGLMLCDNSGVKFFENENWSKGHAPVLYFNFQEKLLNNLMREKKAWCIINESNYPAYEKVVGIGGDLMLCNGDFFCKICMFFYLDASFNLEDYLLKFTEIFSLKSVEEFGYYDLSVSEPLKDFSFLETIDEYHLSI